VVGASKTPVKGVDASETPVIVMRDEGVEPLAALLACRQAGDPVLLPIAVPRLLALERTPEIGVSYSTAGRVDVVVVISRYRG
jgi:hypothetical protein